MEKEKLISPKERLKKILAKTEIKLNEIEKDLIKIGEGIIDSLALIRESKNFRRRNFADSR